MSIIEPEIKIRVGARKILKMHIKNRYKQILISNIKLNLSTDIIDENCPSFARKIIRYNNDLLGYYYILKNFCILHLRLKINRYYVMSYKNKNLLQVFKKIKLNKICIDNVFYKLVCY